MDLCDSDDNLGAYRRWDHLHSRVLLYQQGELAELENQLALLDEEDSPKSRRCLHSGETDRCVSSCRKDLLNKIHEALKEYGKFIVKVLFVSLC